MRHESNVKRHESCVAGRASRVTHYSLLVTRYVLPITRYALPISHPALESGVYDHDAPPGLVCRPAEAPCVRYSAAGTHPHVRIMLRSL